jgi:hypothetical protein
VAGPGYQGWRPPLGTLLNETTFYDGDNVYAPSNPDIYGASVVNTLGTQHTSTMVVEVQVQNEVLNKLGIEGDLAWKTTSAGPVSLPAEIGSFGETAPGATIVFWGGVGGSAPVIELPFPLTGTTNMRLRISELDYYTGTGPPATVDTRYRRPFVAFIPLN